MIYIIDISPISQPESLIAGCSVWLILTQCCMLITLSRFASKGSFRSDVPPKVSFRSLKSQTLFSLLVNLLIDLKEFWTPASASLATS
jgi:hypothetical protein